MGKIISSAYPLTKVNGISINTSKKCHSSNYENYSSRSVDYIVLHYTGNSKDTASANANYFMGANRNASAHFFVDDNSIWQSVELRDKAWHCGGSTYYHSHCRNSNAIGIEMCCTAGNYMISNTTIKNAAYLTAELCKLLGISASQVDKYVLRHYDITHKKCPAQMVDSSPTEDKDWTAFKKQVKDILGGNKVEPPKTTTTTANNSSSYKVKVTCDALNIRAGAGTTYKVNGVIRDRGVYTIVKTSGRWGKLKSGAGWIHLGYTKRV